MVNRACTMSNLFLQKTQSGHHHCIPWILLPQKHIGHAPLLNLQTQFAKVQINRGLSAKVHHFIFGKFPNGKTIITMLILGENYPKTIYGMPHFEFAKQIANSKEMGAFIAKMLTLQK